MGRKLAIDPRQIEHRCNRPHLVIVRHHLFKAERIKQLSLILLQPTHHGPFPPLTASTSENHCSRKPSTDFCNKICQKRKSRCRDITLDCILVLAASSCPIAAAPKMTLTPAAPPAAVKPSQVV